jgi:histone deacetylase 1/2
MNRSKILENLRHLNFAPSVQMHQVPKDLFSDDDEDDDDEESKDKRITRKFFKYFSIHTEYRKNV